MKIAEFDKVIDAIGQSAQLILMIEKRIKDKFVAEMESGVHNSSLNRDMITLNKLLLSHVQIKKELGLIGNPT